MPPDFVRIDLHVHTPASSEDYGGDANDDQYFSILRNAKARDIKIIALTDHNSIEGYITMTSLRERLLFEQQSLSAITDSQQAAQKLLQTQATLSLFEGILILPGIELTVRPGVHMLILFNPSLGLPPIEEFLAEAGYEPGDSSSTQRAFAKWDVFTLLENSAAYDCIVLDPHTDSDKGIWNELSGAYRVDCLRSEQLSGLCYKSEVQRDKINTLLSTPQYKRPTPLPFLRFSDAHSPTDVGTAFTFAKLEDLSFDSLRRAFLNPLESFSTDPPSTVKILNNLKQLSNALGIPNLQSEDTIQEFLRCVCALTNSDGGYILLGLTHNKSNVGLLRSRTGTIDDDVHGILKEVFSRLARLQPYQTLDLPRVECYHLQNGRFVLSLRVDRGPTLVNVREDPSIYSLRKGKVVTLSASEIESLVQDRLLADVNTKILARIQAVEQDCLQIRNLTISLPLMRKFEINSFKIRPQPVIPNSVNLNDLDVQRLLKLPHSIGCARGTLFYLDEARGPRLQNAYLRHSLPLFNVKGPVPKSDLKETIYIVPDGAIYYSKRDYPFYSNRYPYVVKLHSGELNRTYDMKLLVSFLKSSFHLWYICNKYGNTNTLTTDVFFQLRLPIIHPNRPDSKKLVTFIRHKFDYILGEERRFVVEFNKRYRGKLTDAAGQFIDNYNQRIAEHFYAVDKAIYELLGLSQDEIGALEDNLRFNKIYLPANPDASVNP